MHTEQILAVFRSRQQATAFWMNLRNAKIESVMISSPAPLSRGCGISVRFESAVFEQVRRIGGWQRMTAFDGFFRYDAKIRRYIRL